MFSYFFLTRHTTTAERVIMYILLIYIDLFLLSRDTQATSILTYPDNDFYKTLFTKKEILPKHHVYTN